MAGVADQYSRAGGTKSAAASGYWQVMIMMGLRPPQNNEQGTALVVVLWTLALLTVMTMGYSSTMHTEIQLAANVLNTAKTRALAEGGIWYGILKVLQNQTRPWNGSPFDVTLGDGTIELRIYDEAGKIDLNSGSAELLQGLLESTGIDETEAGTLTDAILDWRDPDNLNRLSGTEDEVYKLAGLTYGAKNGPFNSITELRLIAGVTEKLYQEIAPALTVHSQRNAINPDAAPSQVLRAIPGVSTQIMDSIIAANNKEAVTILPHDANNSYISRANSNTFTVQSTGKTEAGQYSIKAIILLKQNSQLPFSVLSWTEGLSAD